MALPILQAGVGLFGAFDAFNKNKGARAYERAAAAQMAARAKAQNRMLDIADGYDPAAETEAAVNYAGDVARVNTAQALGKINADFRKYGGQPGGDTNFQYATNQEMRRVMDPLKGFAAQQKSSETARRLGFYAQALGAGGDMTGNYLAMANQTRANPAPSLELLSGGLESMNLFGQGADALEQSGAVYSTGQKLKSVVDRMRINRGPQDPRE